MNLIVITFHLMDTNQLRKQVFALKDQKTPGQRRRSSQIVHARMYVIFLLVIISLHDELNTYLNSIHGENWKRNFEFVEFGMQHVRRTLRFIPVLSFPTFAMVNLTRSIQFFVTCEIRVHIILDFHHFQVQT